MPRPRKHCRCKRFRGDRVFKPLGMPMRGLESIGLELAELEALRLCDREGQHQEEAGRRMGVSRGTVQRLLSSARQKVASALVESKALIIEERENHADLHSDTNR